MYVHLRKSSFNSNHFRLRKAKLNRGITVTFIAQGVETVLIVGRRTITPTQIGRITAVAVVRSVAIPEIVAFGSASTRKHAQSGETQRVMSGQVHLRVQRRLILHWLVAQWRHRLWSDCTSCQSAALISAEFGTTILEPNLNSRNSL